MSYSPVSRIGKVLLEAFEITRRAPGQVPFKTSTIGDRHIQDIITNAAARTGVPETEIAAAIAKHIKEIEEMKQYSYLLYDTAARNAAENAAFDLIEHSTHKNKERFDPVTFMKLIEMVQLEHQQFFPLRAPGETNYIFSISPILLPSNKKEYAKWNDVITTAAATAKGEFLFNVPFMQKLMDFAAVEGLKPKGKKYRSNGGPIPDEYAYIEFLIMHELLHYSYGDFSTGERLKQYSPTEHNYASDFRSNYMLVKNGYDQLPIGLFSDHINYDRQGSYKEMVELVHNELNKMPKRLQDAFNEIADLDEHQSQGEPKPGEGEDKGKSKLKPGDIVRDKKGGGYWKVTSVGPDGRVDTVAASAEEVAAAKKGGAG